MSTDWQQKAEEPVQAVQTQTEEKREEKLALEGYETVMHYDQKKEKRKTTH